MSKIKDNNGCLPVQTLQTGLPDYSGGIHCYLSRNEQNVVKCRMKLFIFFLTICFGLGVFTGLGIAKEATISEEAQACLECHAKRGIIKKFENSESIQAYVDVERLKASVHNKLTCSQCHTEFSAEKHPNRAFRSKKQYKVRAALICRKCHPDEQISKTPAHSKYAGDNMPVCTDCHGSHSVMPVRGGKILKDERQYCLGCHKHQMHMNFRNKEKMSLTVDVSQLESSVHNKLTCSDCHYGFSAEEHPKRDFRTKRDFSIASSEICRRCHFDKHVKIIESDCYSKLSHGNLNAPVCTDCHGAHTISHFGKERTLIAQRCRKCHPEIYETYANSVHGRDLIEEQNEDVPVCVDCHKAHDINNPLTLDYRERIPEMCSKCHSNKAVMAKYGLSTNVVKTYLSDFHGITLDFYKKQRETLQKPGRQIAVCTDCHGTHNISSTIGTEANLLRTNLIKRCQKCHENATENFPDAWLSHYEPSLKKAPMVFIVNLLYKIFMPIMIIGLLLQILLHIWRYAVNR